MLKFVLCALFAVALADPEPAPGAVLASYPYAYSSTYLAAPTTTITKTASGYIANPSPYFYSSPYYPHYIKKRSAPFYAGGYIAPSYGYSAYSAPLLTSTYSAPLVHSAPYVSTPLTYSAPAHFIKKRSAPLLPYSTSYIAPAATSYSYSASAPLLTSYAYGAAPYVAASPYYSAPFAYSGFIKK